MIGYVAGALLDRLKGSLLAMRQFENYRIVGGHGPARKHHCHHARLADEGALGRTI